MALTLLVEKNPRIAQIFRLNLATYAGLDVVVVPDGDRAIRALDEHAFRLVISRDFIDGEDTATVLSSTLQEKKQDLPLLIIGQRSKPAGSRGPIASGLDVRAVVKGAAEALGITAVDMVYKDVAEYYPIDATFFECINHPVCPLWARDPAGEMQLAFEAEKPIDRARWAAIAETPPAQLFVGRFERLKAVNQITSELVARIDHAALNPDEGIHAAASNQALMTKKLATLGINEETVTLAKQGIAAMTGNVRRHPALSGLLKRMLANQAGPLFRHTQLVTYLALHLVKMADWGTPEQEEKVAFVAFFHDIMLDADDQALIHSKEELRAAGLDSRAKALVEKHAQLAAELVHKYPHAPMGADQIIRQHHGVLNGVGFSDHFGANLSPLAMVFIVAEEFTRVLMARENEPLDKALALKELRGRFTSSRFHKICDHFEGLTV